jgi:hypothetical protein
VPKRVLLLTCSSMLGSDQKDQQVNKLTASPFSTYIKKLVAVPGVHVLRTQTLEELLAIEAICEEMIELGIRRFQIYDYLIADCMRKNQVKTIVTGNEGDFKKFSFIEVINPFVPESPHSAPSA